MYTINVKSNPGFCGVGAFGLHFANGQTQTDSKRAADWFAEHEGYTVVSGSKKSSAKAED